METPTHKIEEGSFAENILIMRDLWKLHWLEVYGNEDGNIWEEHYLACEKAGMLLSLFAYVEGVLVGYSINFLAPNLHRKPLITCTNDALFIDPVFRDGPLGLRLIKATEKKGKEKGANQIVWHAPLNTNLVHILPRLKYEPAEMVFRKEL